VVFSLLPQHRLKTFGQLGFFPSQAGMIADDARELFSKEAKERQGTRTDLTQKIAESNVGEAREKAAKAFGTNPHYVDDAQTRFCPRKYF